jgi:hypothetical protein
MGRQDAQHSRLSGIEAAAGSVDVAIPQLGLMPPHAQRAFDLLVRFVEQSTPLPPDQCIGRGGVILDAPAATGKCAQLFVP